MKNGAANEYQYSITDHQGNTRILFSSITPEAYAPIATFEGGSGDNAGEFRNVDNVVTFNSANHTPSGTKVVRMNQAYPVAPARA